MDLTYLIADNDDQEINSFHDSLIALGKELKISPQQLGYARDGLELLELYRTIVQRGSVDYVFVPVELSDLDGLSLVARIRALCPTQKVVLVFPAVSTVGASKTSGEHKPASYLNEKVSHVLGELANFHSRTPVTQPNLPSILDYCRKSKIDLLDAAQFLGACGCVRKPYHASLLSTLFDRLEQGFSFVALV